MGDRTAISWTDATWNPIRGCSRVSAGCQHCYAETVAARFSKPGQAYEGLTDKHGRWNGRIMLVPKHLADPLRWRKPRKIFVNSMSDVFHENVDERMIRLIFSIMASATQHTFQVLTKRPARMREIVSHFDWRFGISPMKLGGHPTLLMYHPMPPDSKDGTSCGRGWVPPNVWLGVSTEAEEAAHERIPFLLQTPAARRFVSAEPLLGPLDLEPYLYEWADERWTPSQGRGLDWVIIGGESGSGHRPMDVAWALDLAVQCAGAHVPLFVKQDCGPKPGKQGRLPDELWARKEFPTAAVPA